MANTIYMDDDQFSPVFRASFAKVLEPGTYKDSDNKKYSLCLLIPKTTDITALKELAKRALLDQFGSADKVPTKFNDPFGDGDVKHAEADPDKKEVYECFKGNVVINANTSFEVNIVSPDGKHLITDTNQWYSGCYARCKLSAKWYDIENSRGVKFYLGHIQKIKDGEKLGDDFKHPTETFSGVDASLLAGLPDAPSTANENTSTPPAAQAAAASNFFSE